jgi:hypothetical protein
MVRLLRDVMLEVGLWVLDVWSWALDGRERPQDDE